MNTKKNPTVMINRSSKGKLLRGILALRFGADGTPTVSVACAFGSEMETIVFKTRWINQRVWAFIRNFPGVEIIHPWANNN